MARRSSLLLLVVLIQVIGLSRLDAQPTLSGTVRDAQTITILQGSRRGAPLNPQDQPAPTCTMRVMPVDPSIDQKMLKEPDAMEDYTIKIVPPPCQASHLAQNR